MTKILSNATIGIEEMRRDWDPNLLTNKQEIENRKKWNDIFVDIDYLKALKFNTKGTSKNMTNALLNPNILEKLIKSQTQTMTVKKNNLVKKPPKANNLSQINMEFISSKNIKTIESPTIKGSKINFIQKSIPNLENLKSSDVNNITWNLNKQRIRIIKSKESESKDLLTNSSEQNPKMFYSKSDNRLKTLQKNTRVQSIDQTMEDPENSHCSVQSGRINLLNMAMSKDNLAWENKDNLKLSSSNLNKHGKFKLVSEKGLYKLVKKANSERDQNNSEDIEDVKSLDEPELHGGNKSKINGLKKITQSEFKIKPNYFDDDPGNMYNDSPDCIREKIKRSV